MPFTLTMPKLSPTMDAGTIVKWKKKVGDFIKADEVLFEVATDKATVEHTVLDDGFLKAILIPAGKEAKVGQAVAVFTETKDEDISSYKPEGLIPEKKVEKSYFFYRAARLCSRRAFRRFSFSIPGWSS